MAEERKINSASIAATGGNITTPTAVRYTWAAPNARALVFNHPDAPGNLYVVWNAAASTDVSAISWEYVVPPGSGQMSPKDLSVQAVAIYSDANMTYQTDFAVRGWK